MKIRTLTFAVGAVLLASCKFGNDRLPATDNIPALDTVTSKAASEIANNTTESALPIDLNNLQLSDADTDETFLPQAVN